MFQTIGRYVRSVLRPGSAALWAGALFLLLFATLTIQPIQPADFWWHLKVGEIVLDEGRIPRVDLFSYTVPDQPFIYQSWLAGVVFALLYRLDGPAAVVLLNAVLITLAYGLLWCACQQEGDHPYLATAGTFAAVVVSAGNWGVRPQTFSTLFFALFLLVLVRFRRGKRSPLWLLPLLVALWANLHGAFVLGPALLGATLVGEVGKSLLPGRPFPLLPRRSRWALLATTLASLAAPLLNPVGWRIFAYLRTIQGHPVLRQAMAEWKPPRTSDSVGAVFYLSLLGLFFLLLYLRHRPDPAEALWLVGTTWLALGGVRSILWCSFVMALLAVRGLAGRPWPRPARPQRWQAHFNLALLGLLAGLAVLALPWCKGLLPLPADLQGPISWDTPVQAAERIAQEDLTGRLFHRMEYGGYLLWYFYPQRAVFIDSRIELYPEDLWEDYARISSGVPEAEELLKTYEVDVLLLDTRFQAGLLEQLRSSAKWEVHDEIPTESSVILTRRERP